jgi:23S rRNA pseudouridine1911/1915/1917 synthase
MILEYKVKDENLTINYILRNKLQISSRLFVKLLKNKLVYINGKSCDTRNIACIGDIVSIDLNYKEDNSNIVPKEMDLNIIYEDEAFIVLNKPSGIAVHPSMLHFDNTISNGLKFYFDNINLHKKIRPVNRLDFNTSGLIVFAKNEYVQECLIRQMSNNTFKKEYLAVVTGILNNKKGTIDKPISRKKGSIIERCVSIDGKKSVTHFEVINEYKNFSLVKCILETGRTHQIRVHFASIGHPLLGDDLYGKKCDVLDGQALLCYKLSFIHPINSKLVTFELDENYFDFLRDSKI